VGAGVPAGSLVPPPLARRRPPWAVYFREIYSKCFDKIKQML
jgi:hypothetical protein